MLKKLSATILALAGVAIGSQAVADDGWWQEDNYRVRQADHRYDDDRNDRYRHKKSKNGKYRERGYRQGNSDYVYADVVDVEPIYRYVQVRRPQRECWDEEVYDRRGSGHHQTAGASIAGGLIGGVVGRQFGDGKGRDAMTVVGTLVGSAIAHDRAIRDRHNEYDRPRVRVVERCETHYETYEDQRLEGYNVTYVYGGREYVTRTAQEPGRQVRVRVAVTPVRYSRRNYRY